MRIKKSDLIKLVRECMMDVMPGNMLGMPSQDMEDNISSKVMKMVKIPRHMGNEWEPEEDDREGRMLDYGEVQSDSDEGYMAKAQLNYISTAAQDLEDMLYDADDLPQWCQTEIAIAKDKVSKVYDYLAYKIKRKGTVK
jgi:hypothetical protein